MKEPFCGCFGRRRSADVELGCCGGGGSVSVAVGGVLWRRGSVVVVGCYVGS